MTTSVCINPSCKHPNAGQDIFCAVCQSELLIEGQYRATRLLNGKGLYCDTYEVQDQDSGEYKVLKLLKYNEPKLIELFNREFAALNQSSHPGIPRADAQFVIRFKNSIEPVYCLVMQKIAGSNLEDYLKQRGNPIDQKMALRWLRQLTKIIHEIHRCDLFHRDIKPSNIMLQGNGQLVLIDFGAVGVISNLAPDRQQTIIYTQDYAAPEQLKGAAVPQSDFFSIGRTFAHLLTGKPISDRNPSPNGFIPASTWHQHTTNLSPSLIDLINRLMDQKVERRPVNTQEIIQCLDRFEGERQDDVSVIEDGDTEVVVPLPGSPSSPTCLKSTHKQSRLLKKRLVPLVAGLTLLGLAGYRIQQSTRAASSSEESPKPSLSATPSPTAATQQCGTQKIVKKTGNNLFGVIEIGSSGVKGEVVQELGDRNQEGYTLEPREEDIEAQDVNPINPSAQKQTVKAVQNMFLELQERFNIPCEHIALYGSSGFAQKADAEKPGYKNTLVSQIQSATGRSVDIITPDQEATYVFNAIVPEHRQDQVLMIDVGSGNTKGAFLNQIQSQPIADTVSIPWGTKSLTTEIDKRSGSQSFLAALAEFKQRQIPSLRQKMRLKPILESKSRVYLSGGITWALATLTHPCQAEQVIEKDEELPSHFVRLRYEDLTTFFNNVIKDQKTLFNPDFSHCTPEQKAQAQKDIQRIRTKVFTLDELTAGAELLRMLGSTLNFQNKDAIFFSRYAFEALPIGYLKEQISLEKQTEV